MEIYNNKYFEERLPIDDRRKIVWEEICHFFNPFLPNPVQCVVELGAGYCFWINNIKAIKKIAIDLSSLIKDYAGSNVDTVIGDATDLSFVKNGSVDVVLASNFFEHLNTFEVDQTVNEIYRVLRVGGRLFILQPNFKYAWREYFDDYTHKTIFTDIGLCGQLKKYNFKIIKCWSRLVPFSFKTTNLTIPRFLIRLYLLSPFRPSSKQMAVIAEK